MKIGIPKETKKDEFRVPLIPKHVKILADLGNEIYIEKDAGKGAGFPDEQYEKAGAKIVKNVWNLPMILKVKEPEIKKIKPNQIIMAYLHVEKGQNPELLEALLRNNVTAYAYEEIRDEYSKRLVNLGFEAGVVGMYEGLRAYADIIKSKKLKLLPPIKRVRKKKAYEQLVNLKVKDLKIAIMGNGNVARGVQEVLSRTNIKPIILDRTKTTNIEKYLPKIDILVNGVVWYPNDPVILKRRMLKLMKKKSLIIDITCDKDGSIETCIPTTWKDPTYQIDGITHSCIDNLPSAIPRESSIHLSNMILPFVFAVANQEAITEGLMTKDSKFLYTSKIPTLNIVKKIISSSLTS